MGREAVTRGGGWWGDVGRSQGTMWVSEEGPSLAATTEGKGTAKCRPGGGASWSEKKKGNDGSGGGACKAKRMVNVVQSLPTHITQIFRTSLNQSINFNHFHISPYGQKTSDSALLTRIVQIWKMLAPGFYVNGRRWGGVRTPLLELFAGREIIFAQIFLETKHDFCQINILHCPSEDLRRFRPN